MRVMGLLVLSLVIFGLSSCEDKQEANLYKAQICLNTASSATDVDGCLAILGSQSNEQANVIRCSAAFLREGINDAAIVQAIENIDGDQGGDPTSATFAALTMSSTDAAQAAVTACNATGSAGLIALADLANVSTNLTSFLGLTGDLTPEGVATAIENFDPMDTATYTDAEKAALGSVIISSQGSLCTGEDALVTDSEACNDINAAIAGNSDDPTALVNSLLANLDNN